MSKSSSPASVSHVSGKKLLLTICVGFFWLVSLLGAMDASISTGRCEGFDFECSRSGTTDGMMRAFVAWILFALLSCAFYASIQSVKTRTEKKSNNE